MKNKSKKRGQKFLKKFSRANEKSIEHLQENLVERVSSARNVRLLILEWGLLVFLLIMLAVTQAFWFGSSYANTTYTSGGTYTEATIGDVKSMNPLFATTNSEKVLSKLMFATISTIDYSGHPNIGLAQSITSDETGKIWQVKLRDNLKWSDGTPITNQDIIFTVNLIQNPNLNSIYSSNLANVKVSEGENGEIIFTLAKPYADFISALNIPVLPIHILENADLKTLIEHNFSNSPVTSGPFKFNALQTNSNSEEKVIYLSANQNYYGGTPLLNTFAIHTYPDKDAVIKAINSDTVTATAELSSKEELQKVTSKRLEVKNSSLNSGAFIFFNTSKENIKNLELRLAIRQGIDLEKIREKAPETLALDYPLLSSQINITQYPALPNYDLQAAKQQIAEITSSQPINLEIATVNSGYLPNVASTIKEELKNLGLEANVSVYEENQDFLSNVLSKRAYDILVYEVELGADPDPLPYYHSSQASATGLNLSNYRNSLADDLLLGGRNITNEDLRIKKYEAFLNHWVSGVPAIALYQPNLTYFYNKNARTFSDDIKLVTAIDRFSDVTDWAVNKTTKNKTP